MPRLPLLLAVLAATITTAPRAQPLDPSFGTGGVARLADTAPYAQATAVLGLPGGASLAVGTHGGRPIAWRLTASGVLDPTFGTGGAAVTAEKGAWFAAAPLSDGRVLVVGTRFTDGEAETPLAAVLRPDGTPDPTFGAGGLAAYPVLQSGRFVAALPVPGGVVVVKSRAQTEGSGGDGDPTVTVLSRLRPDGSLDASYGGPDGVAVLFDPDYALVGYAAAAGPDGSVVVVGSASPLAADGTDWFAARLRPDGLRDDAYGLVRRDFGRQLDLALAVALDDQGRAVLTGAALSVGPVRSSLHVVRLLPSGAPDLTFGADGTATPDVPGPARIGTAVRALPGGAVLVAGAAGTLTGAPGLVARLLPSGALDPAFGAGGVVAVRGEREDAANVVSGLALDVQGRVVAVATATYDDGERDQGTPYAVRLVDAGPVSGGPRPQTPGGLSLSRPRPNPAVGRFALDVSTAAPATLSVTVTDALGRTVHAFTHVATGGLSALAFDTRQWAAGLYVVSVSDGLRAARATVTVAR